MTIREDFSIRKLSDDRYGRKHLVEVIASAIQNKAKGEHGCYTIGIYGPWGEGKTSVLNMLQDKLLETGKEDGIVICRYNPWMINNSETLIQEFFDCICIDQVADVAELLKQYGGIIAYAAGGVSTALSKFGFQFISKFLGSAAKQVDEIRQRLPDRKPLVQQKQEINDILRKRRIHLLVMIDDLDRLDKEELHAVFRLIRQVADFDNTTYVLAMDEHIVAQSVGDFYGEGREQDGRKFLEKIVQIPIVLPTVKPQILRNYAKEQLCALNQGSTYLCEDGFNTIIDILSELFHTKREYVRYFNQLCVTWHFVLGEVNMRDLCLLEAIKCCNTQTYDLIEESKHILCEETDVNASKLFLEETEEKLDKKTRNLNDICAPLPNNQKDVVRKIIRILFPIVVPYSRYENAIAQRICSSVYFDKYFTQTILDGYIPDHELDAAIHSFPMSSKDSIIEWLNEHFEQYGLLEILRCIAAIIERSGKIDTQQMMAMKLLPAVAQMNVAHQYGYSMWQQRNHDTFAITMVSVWMTRYFKPIKNVKDIEQLKLSALWLEIVQNAPVSFSMALFGYFDSIKEMYPPKAHCFQSVFLEMTKRLDEVDSLEFSKYSFFLQRGFFRAWQTEDENDMCAYIRKKLSLKRFDVKAYLDQWDKDEQLDSNISLFKKCIPNFVKRIRKDYPEENTWSHVMRTIVDNGENKVAMNVS